MAFVKDTIKDVATGLPPWAKGVATLAILGGVAYGVYKIYDTIGDIQNARKLGQSEKKYADMGQKKNYTPSQYQSIADTFEKSSGDTWNPFDLGNEDALWKLAKAIKSDLDFIEIEKAFGERYGRLDFSFTKIRLVPYVNYMYDPDEVNTANDILKQNKVTSTF